MTDYNNPESVHTVIYADKEKGCIEHFEYGRVSASEGLRLANGRHVFRCELLTGESGAVLFAEKILTGERIASKTVVATTTVEIRPAAMGEVDGYEVNTQTSRRVFESYDDAMEFAKQEGAAIAEEHVREQGAAGKVAFTYDLQKNEAKIDLGSVMWMSDTLTVTATGNPGL